MDCKPAVGEAETLLILHSGNPTGHKPKEVGSKVGLKIGGLSQNLLNKQLSLMARWKPEFHALETLYRHS